MEITNPIISTVLKPICDDGSCCETDDCSHGPTEWAMCEADRRPTLHIDCLLALADDNGDLIYFANEINDTTGTLSIDPLEQLLISAGLDATYPDNP